jgi:hypothetical protein
MRISNAQSREGRKNRDILIGHDFGASKKSLSSLPGLSPS